MITTVDRIAVFAWSRFGGDEAKAIIATAISLAECPSHDTTRQGDLGIQTARWGPSVGLWQIRTLKADKGKGTDRDFDRLMAASVAEQTHIMARISGEGTNWTPWTVYKNGTYRAHIPAATRAVKARPPGAPAGDPTAPDAPDEGGVEKGLKVKVPDPFQAIGAFAALVSSWATWQRILYLITGAGLIAAGLQFLAADLTQSPTGQKVAGAVKMAAVL